MKTILEFIQTGKLQTKDIIDILEEYNIIFDNEMLSSMNNKTFEYYTVAPQWTACEKKI